MARLGNAVAVAVVLLLLCAKPPQSVLPSPDEVSPLTDPGNDDWNKIVSLDPPPGCCWSARLPGLRYLNSVKTLPAFPITITISQHRALYNMLSLQTNVCDVMSTIYKYLGA